MWESEKEIEIKDDRKQREFRELESIVSSDGLGPLGWLPHERCIRRLTGGAIKSRQQTDRQSPLAPLNTRCNTPTGSLPYYHNLQPYNARQRCLWLVSFTYIHVNKYIYIYLYIYRFRKGVCLYMFSW